MSHAQLFLSGGVHNLEETNMHINCFNAQKKVQSAVKGTESAEGSASRWEMRTDFIEQVAPHLGLEEWARVGWDSEAVNDLKWSPENTTCS